MDILNDNENRLFFRFLIPTIGATLITSIYILADAIIIGRFINERAMAALNVLTPIFSLFNGTGYLLGVGGSVLMSASFGEKRIEKGQGFFTVSVACAVVFSVFYMIVLLLGFNFIVRLIGATDDIIDYVRQYGYILASGAPLFIFSSMLQVFVRNDMSPKIAMAGVMAGGIANVILDYLFIVGFDMGIAGGALATLIGCVLSLGLYGVHFLSKSNRLKIKFKEFSFGKMRRIFKSGFPNFFIEISNAVLISLFNIQLGRLIGFEGITAFGVIENSYLVVNSLSNGVAQTVQPLIAANYGAENKKRVKSFFKAGFLTALIISVIVTLIGEIHPEYILNLFVNADESLKDIAVPAIRIYFVSFLMAVSSIYLSGYFQAVMMSRYSMIICVLRGLILSGIFVFLFPALFGVSSVWYVMPAAELITLLYGIYALKCKIKL